MSIDKISDQMVTNLTDADLTDAILTGAILDETTVWPEGFNPLNVIQS